MKKLIASILVTIMVLSLCACAPAGEEEKPQGLQVGFGTADMTPKYSVGLAGYADSDTRRSEGVVDKIYISCLAFTEGEETILIYTMDLGACNETIANTFRGEVAAATGVAKERIFCSATHNHSAPAVDKADPDNGRWVLETFVPSAVKAAQDAMADRASATILTAQESVEKMTFVRHYKKVDGSYAGSNFGTFGDVPIEDYAVEADDRMTLVKFDRADDKGDILLVNWAAHVDQGNALGRNNVASGYVGPLRDKLAADTGMKVFFVTGASGNLNPDSRITADMHNLNPKAYGEKLAESAVAILPKLKTIEGSGIQFTRYNFEAEIDHSWDHLKEEAQKIWEMSQTDTGSALALCREYNMSSYHQARVIVRRAAAGQTDTFPIYAFRVGGLGFISGHYEMFTESGRYIKDNSPFETTVLMTGNNGYIATEIAYDYRSYEADTGSFAKGTAEKLAEKFVELLKEVQ